MPQKEVQDLFLSGKFILFGEDDEDDREMLVDVFASIDDSFQLTFVSNGRDIFSVLEKLHPTELPCLLVLDYNMPEINGAEILKELSRIERYQKVPKVVWSTSGSEKFKKNCLESGAVDYIIKPSSITDLEKIARHMLSFC